MTARTPDFLAALAQRVLICDGAVGTLLHAAGVPLDEALPAINLTAPDLVNAVHTSYIDAGVDIVQTNTFGASRLRLASSGYGGRVAEINAAGVRMARQAAGRADRSVLVAGSVSPAVTVQQRGLIPAAERVAALREQIEALDAADVDLLILETFGYVDELAEAVGVAAEIAAVPIVAQATFSADLRTFSGHSPAELVHLLDGLPVDVLGVNCTLGPQGALEVMSELVARSRLPVSVQPNAGLPRWASAERLEYDLDAEYFARYCQRFLERGAALVGGCCGTTPLHLTAAAKMVHARGDRPPTPRIGLVAREGSTATESGRTRQEPGLTDRWMEGRFIIGAHIVPDTSDRPAALALANAAKASGVDFVFVGDAPGDQPGGAVTNVSIDLAATAQDELALPAVPAVVTRSRTIMALQAQVLGAHARGVTRLVCQAGDPPLVGDHPTVDGTWDVDSLGLIELLTALNRGADHHGLRLATRMSFQIGARLSPGAHDLAAEVDRTERKLAAGAQFFVTRPAFEVNGLRTLLEAIDGAVPVLVLLRHLRSFDDAEYLRYEVPDTTIPARVMDRLQRAGASGGRVGWEVVMELAEQIRPLARGVAVGAKGAAAEDLAPMLQALVERTGGTGAG